MSMSESEYKMGLTGVGVIGCGLLGYGVAKNILDTSDDLKIVGICDPEQRSIDKTIAGIQPSPRVYADYHDLVAADDIDWVMVSSWNCFHAEQAIAAFEAGKNVFCQKPLATTLEDCRRMKDAWKQSGKLLSIGFTLRYSPHYRRIKELLDAGVVGDIISMEFNETLGFNHGGFIMGNWRRLKCNAGSHLLEKCCHDIDLVNWMTESRASRVASFGGRDFFLPKNEHHIERIGPNRKGDKAYHAMKGAALEHVNPFTGDKDIMDNQVAIIQY